MSNARPALPPFTARGLLPPGDYPLTIDELTTSHLVTAECSRSPTWDSGWRAQLVANLDLLVVQLRMIGPPRIGRIFVDGSFVEDKDHPNDIDGYFECDKRYAASRQLTPI
jgi:hypothetical protein